MTEKIRIVVNKLSKFSDLPRQILYGDSKIGLYNEEIIFNVQNKHHIWQISRKW